MAERSRKVRFSVSFIDHPALDADLISFLRTMAPKDQRELLAIWVREEFKKQKRQLAQSVDPLPQTPTGSMSRSRVSPPHANGNGSGRTPAVTDELNITTLKAEEDRVDESSVDTPRMEDVNSSESATTDKETSVDEDEFEDAFSFSFEAIEDEEDSVDESTEDAFNKAKAMFMI
jgi:hypothetical protein